MKLPDKNTSLKVVFLSSLVSAVFVTYTNIVCLPWDLKFYGERYNMPYIFYFLFRYFYFTVVIFILAVYNLRMIALQNLRKRLLHTFLITSTAYGLYILITQLTEYKADWYGSTLLFQFFIVWLLTAYTGHLILLSNEKQKKELEIEQLKTENLQSRYVALTNQINPHFLFNSLNGLSSLIRKKDDEKSIEYVNKLSDVFRYVLQSDKKSVVTLGEELESVTALSYMMEVRFANKLVFRIEVKDEHKNLKIPVLSLLPLIDNVVVHNIIDSEHKMEVVICLNDKMELSVSNPVYPKLDLPNTNGTGLKNLESRFLLLLNKQVRIKNDGEKFTVYLPLIKDTDENTDC